MPLQPKTDRFVSVDVLRGVAVLGILMVNVQVFAMHSSGMMVPSSHMDFSGWNQTAWFMTHVFFEMKFITIFSALFGAGIVMMLGEEASTGRHYRRMLWLLAIGLVHAYVFWYGDILVSYALMGMLVVMARRMRPLSLILLGLALTVLSGLLYVGMMSLLALVPDAKAAGVVPTPEQLEEVVSAYRSGFVDRLGYNALQTVFAQLGTLFMFGGRLAGVMLIGMALFKTGFLTARWSVSAYTISAVIALGLGIPLAWHGGEAAIASGFALGDLWFHIATNFVSSLLMAFGYAAVVMLICKAPLLALIRAPFAAVGRMAFTNYLTHTLVMTYIFVGAPGLGLFGAVERADQVQLVLLVWLAQLIISPIWLAIFRFGPMEWVWRSLTYGRPQPVFRVRGEAPPATPA